MMIRSTRRRHAAILAFGLALAQGALQTLNAQQPLNPRLTNWPAPLYWAPTPAEADQQRVEQRILQRDAAPLAQAASIFAPPGPMTFIAITPCRVMDTRQTQPFTGAFGPPSLGAYGAARQVPMPSSSCNIPSNAGAYSLNVTVVPPGPLSFLAVWPAGQAYPGVSTLNDPVSGGVVANAAVVVAGSSGAIQMIAGNPTDVIIDINGYYITPTDGNGNTGIGAGTLLLNTTGTRNTASGYGALQLNTTGSSNTADGAGALVNNTSGGGNTASGASALQANTSGGDNTASGLNALYNNTSGGNNTAAGALTLFANTTGIDNTASGASALVSNTIGNSNTASGFEALLDNQTGNNNTADGYQALQSNNADGNTASGYEALQSNTTGSSNTASGFQGLQHNTTGGFNTASGYQALQGNTTGSLNTAGGVFALAGNIGGIGNTATGESAMSGNTSGSSNTASGVAALGSNTTGNNNTASGYQALNLNTTGGNDIAIGYQAAQNVSGVNSNNIHVGSRGVNGDNGTIKIGEEGLQTSTYIAGIYNETVGIPSLLVCLDSTGKLGTSGCSGTPSSGRFKEQITDIGDASNKLLQLRPVTFFYKPPYDDGSHALQYGLIAEEVAKVYPEMVGYDKDGQPSSVKYQSFVPLLLNEVQKQAAQNRHQADQNRQQTEQIRSLEERLAALAALLSGQTPAAAKAAGTQ